MATEPDVGEPADERASSPPPTVIAAERLRSPGSHPRSRPGVPDVNENNPNDDDEDYDRDYALSLRLRFTERGRLLRRYLQDRNGMSSMRDPNWESLPHFRFNNIQAAFFVLCPLADLYNLLWPRYPPTPEEKLSFHCLLRAKEFLTCNLRGYSCPSEWAQEDRSPLLQGDEDDFALDGTWQDGYFTKYPGTERSRQACLERDGGVCVITKAEKPHVCQILDLDELERFEPQIRMLFKPAAVHVLNNMSKADEDDKTWNLICLDEDLYRLWRRGQIGLKPVKGRVSGAAEKRKIWVGIEFVCMARSDLDPDKFSDLTPNEILDMAQQASRIPQRIGSFLGMQHVRGRYRDLRTGMRFEVCCMRKKDALRMSIALSFQWAVVRIASVSGAARMPNYLGSRPRQDRVIQAWLEAVRASCPEPGSDTKGDEVVEPEEQAIEPEEQTIESEEAVIARKRMQREIDMWRSLQAMSSYL